MEIKVTGTAKEIKKLLDVTDGSNEQLVTRKELQEMLRRYVTWKSNQTCPMTLKSHSSESKINHFIIILPDWR